MEDRHTGTHTHTHTHTHTNTNTHTHANTHARTHNVSGYFAQKANQMYQYKNIKEKLYRGADKSLARPGRKQATTTEHFEFHISYL